MPGIRSTVRRSNQVLNDEAIASGGGSGDFKVVCNGSGEVDVKQFTASGTSFSQVVSSAQTAGFENSQRNYVVFLDSSGGGPAVSARRTSSTRTVPLVTRTTRTAAMR